MPYEVEEHDPEHCEFSAAEEGEGWDVVNTETEDVKAHHDEKPDAERQVRLLAELEREGDDGDG